MSDLRSRGASPRSVRAMLDAYGFDAYGFGDEAQLAFFIAAQDVYDEIWGICDRQRRAVADPSSSR